MMQTSALLSPTPAAKPNAALPGFGRRATADDLARLKPLIDKGFDNKPTAYDDATFFVIPKRDFAPWRVGKLAKWFFEQGQAALFIARTIFTGKRKQTVYLYREHMPGAEARASHLENAFRLSAARAEKRPVDFYATAPTPETLLLRHDIHGLVPGKPKQAVTDKTTGTAAS